LVTVPARRITYRLVQHKLILNRWHGRGAFALDACLPSSLRWYHPPGLARDTRATPCLHETHSPSFNTPAYHYRLADAAALFAPSIQTVGAAPRIRLLNTYAAADNDSRPGSTHTGRLLGQTLLKRGCVTWRACWFTPHFAAAFTFLFAAPPSRYRLPLPATATTCDAAHACAARYRYRLPSTAACPRVARRATRLRLPLLPAPPLQHHRTNGVTCRTLRTDLTRTHHHPLRNRRRRPLRSTTSTQLTTPAPSPRLTTTTWTSLVGGTPLLRVGATLWTGTRFGIRFGGTLVRRVRCWFHALPPVPHTMPRTTHTSTTPLQHTTPPQASVCLCGPSILHGLLWFFPNSVITDFHG